MDLETEIIDFLSDRVRINQIENFPVSVQKPSLVNRIRGLFSRENKGKNKESEM